LWTLLAAWFDSNRFDSILYPSHIAPKKAMEGRSRRLRLRAWTLVIPIAAGLAAWGFVHRDFSSQAGTRHYGTPRVLTSLTDKRITESSGVAPSRIYSDVYYTFNDSGDSARFFKFDAQGKVLNVYDVPNAQNVDWEDMASAKLDGKPYLFFGDIGDNPGRRKSITVYRVPEPTGGAARADQIIELRYPDGSHNAETLLVHPKTGDITIVTKASLHPAGIYFLKRPTQSGSYVLKKLADIDVNAYMREAKLITGGAWSADGNYVVLRTYLGAYEFHVSDEMHWFEKPPEQVRLNLEMQGEGITYTRSGDAFVTTSEGSPCPVSIIPILK
jgi:hypothetical protein